MMEMERKEESSEGYRGGDGRRRRRKFKKI
jgi:hypothetical protein